jgi:LysR family transcriptional activator of nhaA
MVVVGSPALAAQYRDGFPRSLNGAPFLLPTRNNALRGRIDEWFLQHRVHPDVVGEFEDNALLNTFGRRGLGLFFAPAALEAEVAGAVRRRAGGRSAEVREQFYAISNDRKIQHPAVEAIVASAQKAGRRGGVNGTMAHGFASLSTNVNPKAPFLCLCKTFYLSFWPCSWSP